MSKKLDLEEIKELHDKAYQANQVTRERAADDLVFYWVTQWDSALLEDSQLAFRGEFDVLRKAGRSILADLAANPVQVDFEPIDESRMDGAEVLDGLYRADARHNASIEAFANADTESVVCGFGAWKLYTEYESLRDGTTHQVIRRKPIPEANNTVFFDPNAQLLDKSDAKYCSVLTAFSKEAYEELVKNLTGEDDYEFTMESFKTPERSYVFPWIQGKAEKIYISEFYYKVEEKDKIITFENFLGQTTVVYESALEGVMDDLIDSGYSIINEKEVTRTRVYKYLCSGERILKIDTIPGEHIPIVPEYGERAVIEGEEHYEGITRLAKDPQRLRNFQLSFLADIASRSPREKPIFLPEQVAGFEDMYSETGADNNYPYLLQNRRAPDGTELPFGPVNTMPAPNIPPALASVIELTRQAIEDVANPGLPQSIADPETSGRAVLAVQARIDMQSMVYQEHRKHAIRRDGEIYASMAAEIYDVPRKVVIEAPDGTRRQVQLLETVLDPETGEIKTLRDLRNAEFRVYSRISANYSSQKEQTLARLETMIQSLPAGDPLRNILLLKALRLMDGIDFDDVRKYANKQLILLGVKQPETPEEQAMLEQAAQNQQPSAEMLLAQAELLKGQAQNKEAEIKAFLAQAKVATDQGKLQIQGFDAETKRIATQIDAQEAGADIDYKRIDTFGKFLDNQLKAKQLQDIRNMSTEELLRIVNG